MYAESPIHGSAMLMMNSGRLLSGNPCLGTWVTYGLGSENENLPGFVVMLDRTGGPISGAKNWSSGYMPAAYQATVLRADRHADPRPGLARRAPTAPRAGCCSTACARRTRTTWPPRRQLRAGRAGSPATSWRSGCSSSAPEAVDFCRESAETLALYGIDQPRTADFGRKCLIARRLVERGVRFVQIYSGGAAQRRQLGRPRRPRRQPH